MSSQSSHNPQEVLLAQFSLYVHESGLNPDSFHLCLYDVPRTHARLRLRIGRGHHCPSGRVNPLPSLDIQIRCILNIKTPELVDSATTQETRDVYPMLVQCWNDVVDGGPTLNRHWVRVSCLLGRCPRRFSIAGERARTHGVILPTQILFNIGPASQPVTGLMPVNHYDAAPTLLKKWVCCIFCSSTPANTWHSPNSVSMLTYRLRRWPNIEAALSD